MIIKLKKENVTFNWIKQGDRWNVNVCLMGSCEIDSFVSADEAEHWANTYNKAKEKGIWLSNFFPE